MSTLMEELTAIKAVEDKLTANKVANFAYTDHAYNNPLTEADGVETYNVDNEQNIPVANASILKVNTTILTKGWRAQASAITRMLMNHFLGRCSYNLNKINDLFSLLLTKFMAFLGSPNGIATLDANGRIPYSQLPESAVELKGYWDADTNTPTLADGTGTNGDEYIVSVAGTQDLGSGSQYFNVGDRVLYTGGVWKNITSGFVRTVNNNPPDNLGNIKAVLGTDTFPVARSFLGTMLWRLLGQNWTQLAVEGFTANGSVSTLNFVNGMFLIPSVHGAYWSNDGKHWTACTGIDKAIYSPVYNNGLWVCGSYDGGVWWSNNGKDWTQGTGVGTTDRVMLVYHYADLWLCCVRLGYVWWSEDGKNWTQTTVSGIGSTLGKAKISYNGTIFIADNGNSNLSWSNDGKTWTACTGITVGWESRDLIFANDLWVHASNTSIEWSTDGKTWTVATGVGDYEYPQSLCYAKLRGSTDRWVCSGLNGLIWWSYDGKTWTKVDTGADISFGNVLYIGKFIVLNGKGAFYSFDGKIWQRGMTNTDYSNVAENIRYINGLCVSNNYMSEDGINWSITGLSGNKAYGYGVWVGLSNSKLYVSSIDDLIANSLVLDPAIPLVDA